MPSHKSIQSIHVSRTAPRDLHILAQRHGGDIPHHYTGYQPYVPRIYTPHKSILPQPQFKLPEILLDKIRKTQQAAVSKSTQTKDINCLREFLNFCKNLGIDNERALPAKEDLLMAWAASYAGRLAGKTVSAKLLAIRKEHERRGLTWYGGSLLRQLVKGIEESRPHSSFRDKRAPVTIQILEDLNKGLSRSLGLDIVEI